MKRSSFLNANGVGRGVRLLNPARLRAGAVVLFIVLVLIFIRVVAPNVFVSLFSPLWRAGSGASASVGTVQDFFGNKIAIDTELRRLQGEHEALTAQNLELQARVADLTKLLGSRTEAGSGFLAGVLARPPVSPYDVLIVDRGSKDDVVLGALVFGNGGTPLGTIAATTDHTARALLYSSPGQQTAAWVGASRIAVTLTGAGSGGFSTLVPKEAGVQVGDEVFVSGPGALPIGTVITVEDNPAATKVRVRIRPILNPFSSTWVTISKGQAV